MRPADVAQLVEHFTRNEGVGGSSPPVGFVDRVLADYFAAWNETDAGERAALLERSVAEDVELLDPRGRWRGVAGLSERIAGYHATAPGNTVVPASGVDVHNGIERYAWKIVDPSGTEVMAGLDVAERDHAGRLQRILMFHGVVPPEAEASG